MQPVGAMASKIGIQSFTTSWTKTVNWAKQSGIPQSAYYPVYQMDSQRFLTGSSMSESERVRAIQAAAGLNYSSALPTDAGNPANVIGNIKTNAANIFTGLEPTHLISNIFDTVKNTIEHPSSLLHPLDPHSLASWIPGVTDIALLMQGQSGIKQLLENPLTSLLDVLPITDYVPKILAGTEHGAEIASSLGITTDELSKLKSTQLAWKLTRNTKIPGKSSTVMRDAVGQQSIVPHTLGSRIDAIRNAHGVGAEQSELAKNQIMLEQKGTRLVEAMVKPAIESLSALPSQLQSIALKVIDTDHRPPVEILNDDSIPPQVRNALSEVFDASRKWKQTKMQAGAIEPIKTIQIDNEGKQVEITEDYLTTPGSNGAVVKSALAKSTASQDALDKSSVLLDGLLTKVTSSDKGLDQFITRLNTTSSAVFDSIKKSIPDLPDSAAERARQTLPSAERWDRAVPQSTTVLRNLLGLGPDDVISLHSMNAIRDLMQPGGLISNIYKAYEDQNWTNLSAYSKVAVRKFDNKVFQHLPGGPNGHLLQMRNLVKGLQQYSVQRAKLMDEVDKLWHGTRRGSKLTKAQYRKSVEYLTKIAHKDHQDFIATAIKHPPDVWDSAYLQELTRQIETNEKTASLLPAILHSLQKQDPNKWTDDAISALRENPRTIIEIASRASKDAYGNPMLPDLPIALWKEMSDNAYHELSSLRARGLSPHYIPRLGISDVSDDAHPTYNVHISALRPVSEDALKSRMWDYKPSIKDLQLGLLKGAKEAIEQDILQEFHETYVKPLLHNGPDIRNLMRNYLLPETVMTDAARLSTDSSDAIIQRGIERMGLVKWNPDAIFGNLSTPKLTDEQYINKDIANALQKQVSTFALPAKGFIDKGTKVFRYSILGLSPRFTAHILFGGTFLVALRAHPGMATFLRDAVHYGRTGKLTDDTLARDPSLQGKLDSALGTSSTQEGAEDMRWHYVGAHQLGGLVTDEFMANHPHLTGALGRVQAMGNINFRFTRAVTRAQKSITYLDGAARAAKEGHFYDDVYTEVKDVNGHPVINPVTGKQVYTHSREKVEMTPEQAHAEGMQAVSEVMGDLRKMTPLERNVLLKAFPFYGWTKHILSYVLSYPVDHPYRAMFLSQLASQNSADVASGLPTRIQLLFFLGSPDASGNVSAVDDRFLDPLRDTANYASWTGLFQSLNPVFAAPLAAVDPNFSFGGVPLYPNLTFNTLYGNKEAGAQGGPLTAIEGIVPQVSALDAALNLSGQYNYLHNTSPGGFAKKIAESLNVPFLDVQHLNLRQIAAKQELSRYSQAENDAFSALNTGDFSTLDKYPGTVPDPMGTGYEVTPSYLKALYDETEKRFRLPPTEALPQLPTPQIG